MLVGERERDLVHLTVDQMRGVDLERRWRTIDHNPARISRHLKPGQRCATRAPARTVRPVTETWRRDADLAHSINGGHVLGHEGRTLRTRPQRRKRCIPRGIVVRILA